MQTPMLKLCDRIEPATKTKADQDTVHHTTFIGSFAVSLVTRPEGHDPREQIHVLFNGNVYRFPASEENREGVRQLLGKLGGLG